MTKNKKAAHEEGKRNRKMQRNRKEGDKRGGYKKEDKKREIKDSRDTDKQTELGDKGQ